MSVDEELARLARNIQLPYPEKATFLRELRADFLEIQRSLVAAGMSEEEALAETTSHFEFTEVDLTSLAEVHRSSVDKALSALPGPGRQIIECLSGIVPFGIAFYAIQREVRMINFIRQGGAGMYAILAIGLFLLGREFFKVVRFLILKDHSSQGLKLDTASVLLGCFALMLMGIGAMTLGMYVSAEAVLRSQMSYDILVEGAKESLTPLVMSSLLSALVVFVHYCTRQVLGSWQAPIAE